MTLSPRKNLFGSLGGNSLEFYDFAVYSFLITQISHNFFPANASSFNETFTFLVFALGYLSRPFASLLFGHIGDKYGRTKALKHSIILSTIATVCIGLTPSYESIGLLSPFILIICRLLQGIAVSGEEGGAVVYLCESLKYGNGLIGSLIQSSVFVGLLVGSGLCALITTFLSSQAMLEWGWRLPFVLALPLGYAAYFIRKQSQDSPIFTDLKNKKKLEANPAKTLFQQHKTQLIPMILLVSSFSASSSVLVVFLPKILSTNLQLAQANIMKIGCLNFMASIILFPIIGRLCDKYSAELISLIGFMLFVILSVPMFSMLNESASTSMLGVFLSWYLISYALVAAPLFAILSESFAPAIRYTGVSLSYNISAATFNGLTPALLSAISIKAPSQLSAGIWISLTALISLFSLVYARKDRLKNIISLQSHSYGGSHERV